jgi:hypothetical protein
VRDALDSDLALHRSRAERQRCDLGQQVRAIAGDLAGPSTIYRTHPLFCVDDSQGRPSGQRSAVGGSQKDNHVDLCRPLPSAAGSTTYQQVNGPSGKERGERPEGGSPT